MNIKIVRNTVQTLTWTVAGNYSGDTVKFTVKADKTLTSSRLIDKSASVNYADSISTIIVSLLPSDSALLSADNYYYDLRVENDSEDRELLDDGIAYIDKSVRNDTDGATISDTTTVTTLTGADFNANDTLVSDGSSFVGKSVSEMKTLLGLPVDKYIGYVIGIGSAGDTAFTAFEHIDTKGITLTFAKDGGVGLYAFNGLSSLAIGKSYVFVQMNKSNDYSKKYSIELYSAGTSDAYQLRIYKNGTLSDIDNGDSISFSIMMEDY